MSSDTNEMYYSDSEGSKLLILPRQKTFLGISSVSSTISSSDSDSDCFKTPFATSSPLNTFNNIKNKFYLKQTSEPVCIKRKISNYVNKSESSNVKKCFKHFDKSIPSITSCPYDTPNLLNKVASMKFNNLLMSKNQDKKLVNSTFNNIEPVFQIHMNDVTNTSQSQITLQKQNLAINTTLNKKSKINTFNLNCIPDKTVNSNLNESKHIDLVYSMKNRKGLTKNKIEENQTLYTDTTIISNNSQITYNNIKKKKPTVFNKNCLNDTDLLDIFQMKLSLKMFSGNIVPYLNIMKHDILQIINKCMYEPNKQIIKRSNHVNDIIKNIHNTMKLNMYNCNNSLSKKKNHSTILFEAVDLNSLHLLNNKLECLSKKMESVKFTPNNNILSNQEKKSTDKKLDVQNDFMELKSPDNLKSFEPVIDSNNDVVSSTIFAALDSFSCNRELNKSNSFLFPLSNCIDVNESSKKQSLENYSLICENESPKNEISEIVAQDISYLSYNEPHTDKLAPINKSHSSSFQVGNHNDNSVEKNQSRYWLRNHPKCTEHFMAPFKTISTKKKLCRVKSNYNDMFVCRGTGKKKVILQYKINSVFKANSDEFMKKICPESKNKKFNNDNQNTTIFDISNLKPKKTEQPCQCGIFPSQVPLSWNDLLHKSLHQNLHKLQFKSQMPINVASKINDNGFHFNIIKVSANCDDSKLRLTLKNVQDFISLEIDFSKDSINNINKSIFLALNPNSKIIGYLEIEPIKNACIYQNNQLSKNVIAVKFGVSKLWVMVKYRNNGVATKLLKQFCNGENLQKNDIAFAFHGKHGISFIKNYFDNNSVLIY